MADGYPKKSVVLPGAILGYLVNSIMTAQSSGFASFGCWDNQDYVTNNAQGVYGAIAFDRMAMLSGLVGVFFDRKSERSPHHAPQTYVLDHFFRGMSADRRSFAERALQYMLEIVDGVPIPCITAAFWDDEEYLAAAEPWDLVLAEGGRLVRIQLIEDIDQALAEWQEGYEMTPKQVAFARSLFNRKIAHPEATIELTQAEMEWLQSTSEEPNGEGIAACREKLAAIGILVP